MRKEVMGFGIIILLFETLRISFILLGKQTNLYAYENK